MNNKKIIIYGENGQVGSALATILGDESVVFAWQDSDFSIYDNIKSSLDGIDIQAIINATAYTKVDLAESNHEAAYRANATIPGNLAKFCLENNTPLVHISTDYVFGDSGSNTARKEEDSPSPINIYGKTKLDGEQKIRESGCKYLIFRTSWIYDVTRQNFLTTMLKLGKEREELSIINDQIGAPTYAPDLSQAIVIALKNSLKMSIFPSGIYNLCNRGETNWYGFACKIFEKAKENGLDLRVKKINPISSEQYSTLAKRPKNSRLNCEKAKNSLNTELPTWEESLDKAFASFS